MGNTKKLYQERLQRINTAMERKIPDRVPALSMVATWAIPYAGYTIDEVLDDKNKYYDAYSRANADFDWDAVNYYGIDFNPRIGQAMGGGSYRTAGATIQQEAGNICIMKEDEYPELIRNPVKFIREVLVPRKHTVLADPSSKEATKRFKSSFKEFLKVGMTNMKLVKKFEKVYGMPVMSQTVATSPLDLLMDFLRDFKGIMTDIRRRPQEVIDACDALTDFILTFIYAADPKADIGKHIFLPLHIPTYLRPKDFEKFWWPSMRKILVDLVSKGHSPTCFMEGKWEPYLDILQDLPEGKITGIFEYDDIGLLKEKIGNKMCIAGGISVNDLNYKTREECIKITRDALDKGAPGGGYIFAADKMLCSENDGNPENIRAVLETVKEYGKY